VDDMVVIRGINIFPSQVQAIVERHLEVGEEYQIVAYNQKGLAQLKVICELLDGRPYNDVLQAIRKELRGQLEIRIDAERIPVGTLKRSNYKSRRFVDERTKEG